MYYKIALEPLPLVTEISKIVRKTTWRCADKRNILIFGQEGACYFTIDGQNILLNKGEALLIPAEVPYVRKPYNDSMCTLIYVHFLTNTPFQIISNDEMRNEVEEILEEVERNTLTPAIDVNTQRQNIYLTQKINFSNDFDRVSEQLKAMRAEGVKNLNYYSNLVTSLSLSRLLVDLSQKVITEYRVSNFKNNVIYPQPLQKALLYIQKNYRQKISIETISDVSGVSQQHIIRLFRKFLNTTPVHYINRTKVLHAIDMLRNTELSVQEIAYELGFDNPNYFSRLFKKEEKMSPLDTRKRIRNYEKTKIPSPVTE